MPRPRDGRPGGDGVITATEMYLYLRECVEVDADGIGYRQTPGLWPLKKHDKGEFIHLVPGHSLNLPPAPPLDEANNPWRGLQSYEESHAPLFFGRSRFIATLAGQVRERPLTIVLGASGTGKSSVVKAGLLPNLRSREPGAWQIPVPFRPGKSPLASLAALCLPGERGNPDAVAGRLAAARSDPDALTARVSVWANSSAGASPPPRLLIVVDQFEELLTLCWDAGERERFLLLLGHAMAAWPERLRIVLTLRSDFEPQFANWRMQKDWMAGRVTLPAMTLDEYRKAIEGPASVKVLYFKGKSSSQAFIDRLIGDVANTPGALPLLSFTLSELYRRYSSGRSDDRSLSEEDYEALGGVGGSLRNRADAVFSGLPSDAHRRTMRQVMLRMVSVEGGELARRRVLEIELDYGSSEENDRVREVLHRLTTERLVVRDDDEDGLPYVEPAHDELIRGWPLLLRWSHENAEALQLRRRLSPASYEWGKGQGAPWAFGEPRLAVLYRISKSTDNWLNLAETKFIRFSRRLRLAVTGGTIMTTVLVLAIVASLVWRANARRTVAIRSIHDLSETAIATFLAMDKEGLLNEASTRGLRKRILHDATTRMGLIARDLSDDPETLRFLAEEYIRLADQLNQTADSADALTSYRLALGSLEQLGKSTSDNVADTLRVAFVHNNIGTVLDDLGEAKQAGAERLNAKAICEPLSRRRPEDIECQRLLSAIYGNEANDLAAQGRHAEAMEVTRKAIDIETRLARNKEHPRYLWFLMNLSTSWSTLANLMEQSGDAPSTTLEARTRALDLIEEAVASYFDSRNIPARFEFLSALGRRRNQLASSLETAGKSDEALVQNLLAERATMEALGAYKQETSAATSNHQILQKINSVRGQRSELLGRRVNTIAAFRVFADAAKLALRPDPLYESNPRYCLSIIESLIHKATLVSREGEGEGAIEAGALVSEITDQIFGTLFSTGDLAKAADFAEGFGQLTGSPNAALVARWLERCASAAKGDKSIDESRRAASARAYLAKAKEALKAVIDDPANQPTEIIHEVAWLLLTAGEKDLRDAARARVLVEAALQREPDNGDYWNTLALAHARQRQWEQAILAESKALPRRGGGNGYDFYLLAWANSELGKVSEASKFLSKAEGWRAANAGNYGPDLDALREETRLAIESATSAPKTR